MTEPTPNSAQQKLIENTDGIYVVDAGAGTGKTFAITRRYAEIVDQPSVEPENVLLVTFTRSAATEMKERIVDHSSYSLRELADGSIQTFHSHCFDILQEHGYRAPTHLGLDERITGSTRVVEDELVENELFREFIDQFRDNHPEYADVFRALSDSLELLDVVSELASKGVFPTTDGWYLDSEESLDGDFDAFKLLFDDINQPRNDGRKQSRLRKKLNRYGRNKTYLPDAPAKGEVRGDGTKQIPSRVAELVFDEDREDLKAFVHDVYIEYLDFALSRNYLTFGFLQLFAFVLLCEDDALRERAAFDYVMVDEFQDTSEIQFKLALLLAGTDNICVVGDWKQSIYSFQYADVENILEFEARLDRFTDDLDDDRERIQFEADEIARIELTENYRSTQTVLDFSEEALVTPATNRDDVDDAVLDDVVSLSSNAAFDNTTIEGVHHPDEHEAVLSMIQDVVGNEEYAVEDNDGNQQAPSYGDIAVLTRTRDFGRELLTVADEYDFPMAYDGGIELFRTDQAKLLLAWLRILEADADKGWAVVLEEAGYTLDEIDHILDSGNYPANMVVFRDELDKRAAVGAVARAVFDRYGFSGEYADVILHTIQSIHESSTLTRGDLIRFIERGIENGSTHDVFTSAGVDSVTVQTIHSAKGLEYPIIVLANMNSGKFPPNGGGSSVVQYTEPVGLRQRKQYATVAEHPHVYDNWRHDVIRHCLSRDYDEERRLLYVAITRAERHVVFTGGEEPNKFFEELPCSTREVNPTVEPVARTTTAQTQLPFSIVSPDGPTGHTPHTLMDSEVFADDAGETESVEFRGRDFGSRVHDFAEAYALGENVTPTTDDANDEQHVKAFLDSLPGELHVEERAMLPLEVDGARITISGIVDLVHETPTEMEIVDYKTDGTKRGETEYRKQLSAYYHVLSECFPDKNVTASLFYTVDSEREVIEPLTLDQLKDLVQDIKSGVNVPTYVLEYLVGQYCATDDEESMEEGLEKVKEILSKHYVRPDEAEFVKSEVRERGRYRVIDKVTVTLDEQQDAYIGSFVNLGLNDVEISEHLVSKHPKLLEGGVWAIIDLEYLPDNANGPKSLFGIDSFKPIQVSNLDLEQLKDRRREFTRDEWMNLLLQSVGYDPSAFDEREKLLFLARCIPLVESNYNYVELGPRGTGKSYLYREISPHSILISGGKTTVAKLFLNLNTGRIGLVGRWDVVAFDEVGGLRFTDSEAVQMLKDYMESGSFSRGTEELTAQASMVYVGNIDLDVEGVLKSSHLFEPFPDEMQDLALIDRFHYYLPGWEVPKMRSEFFGDQSGFIVDYFAKFVRELRKESYGDIINEEFAFGDHLNQRDEKAVRKTVSGLTKLLHPHGEYTKEELREYLEFAMEGRRRVKEQLKRMGGMEYRAVEFSYLDLDTKEEIYVTVPEEADETLIPPGTQKPGAVYTIGEDEGTHAPFRIETQTLPGSGKTNISGTPGSKMKESFETACDYLQANMRELRRDETLDEYNINVQVLNPSDADEGGETSVGLLVGIVSGILDRPVRSQAVVLGAMSLMGELVSVSSLVDKLQLAVDSGARTVLLPANNKEDLAKIPDELLDQLQLVFYTDPLDAASKAIELE